LIAEAAATALSIVASQDVIERVRAVQVSAARAAKAFRPSSIPQSINTVELHLNESRREQVASLSHFRNVAKEFLE
jgi:hypothetical protein